VSSLLVDPCIRDIKENRDGYSPEPEREARVRLHVSKLRRWSYKLRFPPVADHVSQRSLPEPTIRLRLRHRAGSLVCCVLILGWGGAVGATNDTQIMQLCLKTIGDTVATSPSSAANMGGAIDSTISAEGPIFLDHNETIGSGETNVNVLAQTEDLDLVTHTGVDLNVRANTVVVAASYGLTDRLDLSLVLPVVQEHIDVRTTGTFTGHTAVTFAGASDLAVRLKYRLLPWLSTLLKASFPTGNPDKGLGAGEYFLTPGLTASEIFGPVQLNALINYNVDLSFPSKSSLSYGAGVATLLRPWLGVAVEFLGESGTGAQDPLIIFGTDYSQQHTFAVAFGLRAILPYDFMAFVAGSYALNRGGLRANSVFPTIGVGGHF
jgi:hypothetical protein